MYYHDLATFAGCLSHNRRFVWRPRLSATIWDGLRGKPVGEIGDELLAAVRLCLTFLLHLDQLAAYMPVGVGQLSVDVVKL